MITRIFINSLKFIFLYSADVEKAKRKVEGDLKLTQEAVADLERNKKELEQTIQRKDKELSSLTAKLEDEQSLVGKLQKQIKELQARIEELEEEVWQEKCALLLNFPKFSILKKKEQKRNILIHWIF